jgi:hypothetical protein
MFRFLTPTEMTEEKGVNISKLQHTSGLFITVRQCYSCVDIADKPEDYN